MHFPDRFYRLPLDFDAEKLRQEIEAVDESHWSPHPQAFKGNDALILLSNGGTVNDLNYGPMEMTPCMEQLPYLKQVLESFNTVIGRTRLMRLAPGEKVGRHSDVSLYWWHRFRIHVPIITHPEVKFFCENTHVHMQAGEAWTFDNWRYHQVHNNSDITRVHLVIDTVGSPAMWNMLELDSWCPAPGETHTPKDFKRRYLPYQEGKAADFETERFNISGVLSPAELDAIADFVWNDLDRQNLETRQIEYLQKCLNHLKRAWRAFYSAHGTDEPLYLDYASILQDTLEQVENSGVEYRLKSNGFSASGVLRTQVSLNLQDGIKRQGIKAPQHEKLYSNDLARSLDNTKESQKQAATPTDEFQPVFISCAPNGGGALLAEILAVSRHTRTMSEAQVSEIQAFFQSIKGAQSQDDIPAKLDETKLQTLRSLFVDPGQDPRLVYFDPWNAVLLPALLQAFPKAKIIYAYRDPRHALWQSAQDWQQKRFYNEPASKLVGEDWCHPLPGQWQNQSFESLEHKLVFQHVHIHRLVLALMQDLPSQQKLGIDIRLLEQKPEGFIRALCQFCEIPFGPRMKQLSDSKPRLPESKPLMLEPALATALEKAYSPARNGS